MLQKNVLEYLEASASRVPDKVAFSDEAEAFTFAQLQSAARSLGTALAQRSARKNAPVVVLVNHRQPIWPPVSVLYMQGISMSRWTVRCPCPGCVPFWKPSPPPPWYMTRRRRRPPKPWRSTVPSSWTGRGLPARRIYPSWLPGAGACWTSTRCTPSLPLAPPVPPKGSSSPTEASLTSSNGWRRPARSPGKTSWATRPPFTLTCR